MTWAIRKSGSALTELLQIESINLALPTTCLPPSCQKAHVQVTAKVQYDTLLQKTCHQASANDAVQADPEYQPRSATQQALMHIHRRRKGPDYARTAPQLLGTFSPKHGTVLAIWRHTSFSLPAYLTKRASRALAHVSRGQQHDSIACCNQRVHPHAAQVPHGPIMLPQAAA